MRKLTTVLAMTLMVLQSCAAFANAAKGEGALRAFYSANALYEKLEYSKAVDAYLKILDEGIESGSLYYNIGNGFLKLGKLGYAILNYEKAKRLMPGDSDLKSNLDYAKSLAGYGSYQAPSENIIIAAVKLPFIKMNLNTLTLVVASAYLVVVILLGLSIANRKYGERIKIAAFIGICAFLVSASVFILRYYDEVIIRHGIVVQKEAECKYEPIDKSTTYYNLAEGDEVLILKTRNEWRRIKRLDGKIAWVKVSSVEPI